MSCHKLILPYIIESFSAEEFLITKPGDNVKVVYESHLINSGPTST